MAYPQILQSYKGTVSYSFCQNQIIYPSYLVKKRQAGVQG